jgi:transcriptional regulator with XRE-family HTH domain
MKPLEHNEFDNGFIASQLKLLRLSTDKKISEIAEATGFTPSYISYIENGKRNLTYKVLRRILLDGFGETLSSFFAKILEDQDHHNPKVFKTPFKLHNEDKTTTVEILIPANASREIELIKVRLSPGSTFEEQFKIDFKLYGTVVNGLVEIQNSNKKAIIAEGESFLFRIQVEDTLEQVYLKISNVSENEAELLLTFMPPVF